MPTNPYMQQQMPQMPMNPYMQQQMPQMPMNPYAVSCTFASVRGNLILSNQDKRFTKKNNNDWNEMAYSSINLMNNGQTYSFTFKVHKINNDRSGLVFGFSNTKELALSHINAKVVGLSGDGSSYNYKANILNNVKINSQDQVKVIVNT